MMRNLLRSGLVVSLTLVTAAMAQDLPKAVGTSEHPLEPADTSSPRATLQTFMKEGNAGWRVYFEGGREARSGRTVHVVRCTHCLDLSSVPPARRDDVGRETAITLLDVLNRIPIPPPEDIPDEKEMDRLGRTRWTLPHTPITIARVAEGSRAGEWLFTPEVVANVSDYYQRTRQLPLKPAAAVDDGFEFFIGQGGWMIPTSWITAMPDWARQIYFGQTLWQWISLIVVLLLATLLALAGFRWSRRAAIGTRRRLIGPVILMLLSAGVAYLTDKQLNIAGKTDAVLRLLFDSIFYVAFAWGVMAMGSLVAERIIASPRIRHDILNAHLLRLCTRLVSFLVALLILVEGARAQGVPVLTIFAGLGVGGLAVALAAQNTVENLIGSLTLFADRPVRVGDFCRYGEKIGTIEDIGLRSTRIRGIDRTVTTVPNGDFSKMQITNLTKRDVMLTTCRLGLRYETTPEQLRHVLAKLRELLLAHPKVTPDPARVRFVGFGDASLNLEIFAYVRTSDWNEFLGIQEDIYLRMMDVVAASGTGFAFPSQTVYLTRDKGLDWERSATATAEVQRWREEHKLPFPEFDLDFKISHRDTLDFPPTGSQEAAGQKACEKADRT